MIGEKLGKFEFYTPTKIFFGKNRVEKDLGNALKQFKATKVLLTYGSGSIKRIGLYDKVVKVLKELKLEWVELGGIKPNPRVTTVRKGIKMCREQKLDFILAVGGGSTIDCSKAISRGVFSDVEIWEHFVRNIKSISKDKSVKGVEITKVVPIGTILTLAATGSEMNGGGVITNLETKEKFFCGSDLTKPVFSILDPTITYSVPVYQTKAGGFDIMSHLLEQYFSENSPYVTEQITISLLKTMVKYLPIAIKEPKNYEARSNIMWCGTLALNGLPDCGKEKHGWNTHKIEHEVSVVFPNFTHGIGLSIITPGWMYYTINKKMAHKYVILGNELFGMNLKEYNVENGKKFIAQFEKWLSSIEIPIRFSEAKKEVEKFTEENAKEIAQKYIDHFWNPKEPMGWENLSPEKVHELVKSRI